MGLFVKENELKFFKLFEFFKFWILLSYKTTETLMLEQENRGCYWHFSKLIL